ncbi:MAG: hybrid sensor histidine kinase/response regulator [Magnetococcales bacterium]|nr:hybrid sensor histidine kinase/response regulator [Magnetococcales bacterium]
MSHADATEPTAPADVATVLIVDDVSFNLHVLADLLRGDYRVKVAIDGPTALAIAAGPDRPDIILLDVMMPDMDGYEVCRRLKADPATREIPVVFVTARGEEQDESRGFEVGAVDYITKPVRPSLVRQRVRTHLSLKRARDTLLSQNLAMESAARLRDDVDRIMRHDLKSPLITILGMTDLLLEDEDTPLPATHREYVNVIDRFSHVLLEMINLSLDLYKMETGNYHLRPAPMDLLALMRQVIRQHAAIWQGLHFRLTVAGRAPMAEEGLEISAEKLLCLTLLGNLLRNACEASPGKGRVDIDLRRRDDGMVGITMVNQGEVAMAVRDRFFEKYSTSGKERGTGLGTYSARLMAQAHGGEITLDTSCPGHTRLEIVLPVRRDAGESGGAPSP